MKNLIRKLLKRFSKRKRFWHDEDQALRERVARSKASYTPKRNKRWYEIKVGW